MTIPAVMVIVVPQNIHAGVSGNDSIIATGVFSAHELLRLTRRKLWLLHGCIDPPLLQCSLFMGIKTGSN